MPLDFDALRAANVQRCNEVFHPLKEWSPTDYGCALAGETGEACNLLKKLRRGEDIAIDDVAEEIADVVIYADLLLARLDRDLGEAVRAKFNKDSAKRKTGIRL